MTPHLHDRKILWTLHEYSPVTVRLDFIRKELGLDIVVSQYRNTQRTKLAKTLFVSYSEWCTTDPWRRNVFLFALFTRNSRVWRSATDQGHDSGWGSSVLLKGTSEKRMLETMLPVEYTSHHMYTTMINKCVYLFVFHLLCPHTLSMTQHQSNFFPFELMSLI